MDEMVDSDMRASGEEDGMDPRGAAALIDQTKRDARRQFELGSPALALVRAGLFFVGYAPLWLSTRHQHPYRAPTGPALLVLFGAVAVLAVTSAAIVGPRVTGVGGRAQRERRVMGVIIAVTYIGIFTFEGALHRDGFGDQVAFGVWAACGPILVLGPIVAMHGAQQDDWAFFGVGMAMVLVATGAAFAGASLSWAIVGLGCGLAFLAQAVFLWWTQRR